MKKLIGGLLVAVMVLGAISPSAEAAEKERGGFVGLLVGCCFGVRAAGDYNSGKDIHFREWVPLAVSFIPYCGGVISLGFHLWDGIDGAQGKTRAEYAEQYGSTYF
jgi:hypothetical protein